MNRLVGSRWLFALGCLLTAGGVAMHLPMFLMARDMGYQLVGMPVDGEMVAGMAAIIGGIVLAAIGLLPPPAAPDAPQLDVTPSDDLPLGAAHWRLMAALVLALVIDVMKPASLGFTVPGMAAEYGLPKHAVALLPFSALTGTVLGSLVWGALADRYGRRATIMLSAVMFVGTSICGAMPAFSWNVGMCLLMGMAAGGMLPVAYALLAEMMPRRHRGWALVMVGGLGAAGGFAVASLLSATLQPLFGWRILWLANLPTGLLLVALGPMIPESARFLAAHGRRAEALAILARFGAVAAPTPVITPDEAAATNGSTGLLVALSVAALAWGWANFGVLLWLPADLVARGVPVGTASALIARSALIAIPMTVLAAGLYARSTPRAALALTLAALVAGLLLLLRTMHAGGNPVAAVGLVLVGTNGIIAVLLPFAAESFALRVRARATGWIAACTKAGGLAAQALGLAGLVVSVPTATAALIVPTLAALALVLRFGRPRAFSKA